MEKIREGLEARSRIGLTWVGGIALLAFGAVLLLGQIFSMPTGYWAISLIASGVVFAAIFLLDQDHWWGLIPAYALVAGGVFLAVADDTDSSWAGIYWPLVIVAPFVAVFATNPKQRWWALIPAYSMLVIGVGMALINDLTDLWIPAFLSFAIAPPFFVVYAVDTKRAWALVTGGITALVGVGFAVAAMEIYILAILVVGGIFLLARLISWKRGQPAWLPHVQKPASGPEADRPPADFEPVGAPMADMK